MSLSAGFVCFLLGVRLLSRFQNTLVDLIYFLHRNLDADAPSLAEAQLLLYTTVRVEGDSGQGPCQSLVLLNTHMALVREDRAKSALMKAPCLPGRQEDGPQQEAAILGPVRW